MYMNASVHIEAERAAQNGNGALPSQQTARAAAR
jgi:hypothetical protein